MIKVDDVAAYLLHQLHPVGLLQMQNILYFIQAMHIGLEKEALFQETFEASKHGATLPSFHQKYREHPSLSLNHDEVGNKDLLTCQNSVDIVDSVAEHYVIASNSKLRELVKQEKPWKQAYQNTESPVITHESMMNHYPKIVELEEKLMELREG